MSPPVQTQGVSRWWGQKVAVADLTLAIPAGVVGLLGPNGAGKTTFLRLIAGFLAPSQGTIEVLGANPRTDAAVRARIALVPEDEAVPAALTPRRFAETRAHLLGLDDPEAATRRAIAGVGLGHAADRPMAGFSKGMRQRAKVAAALVGEPQVVLLDEPLNGADPQQRASLMATFRRLGDDGRCVIVSSHVLGEIERLTERVAAMVDGRLAAVGTVAGIRDALSSAPRRIAVTTDAPRRLGAALVTDPAVAGVSIGEGGLTVHAADPLEVARLLVRAAVEVDARLDGIEPLDESLAQTFRDLVARR